MAAATFDKIMKSMKEGKYAPIYFLFGNEPFFIDQITDYVVAHALQEEQKGFNQTVVYGRDADAETIISYAMRYPLMADRQVVILKEAQEMRKLDELEPYFRKPVPSTLLVIAYKHKKLDKRTKFYNAVKKHTTYFESQQLNEYKVPEWILNEMKKRGYRIAPKAAQLLTEYTGTSLEKINHSLEKLIISADGNKQIGVEDIERNIGVSKDYNIFELQNALGVKDVAKATKILHYFKANPRANPIQMIIPVLFGFFSKIFLIDSATNAQEVLAQLPLSPYVKDIYAAAANTYRGRTAGAISLLNEYDLRSKGVNNSGIPQEQLLDELVYKLLFL
ncbi:MAG: DNA polymerase III subunit delta [Bacteroidia bacterium]